MLMSYCSSKTIVKTRWKTAQVFCLSDITVSGYMKLRNFSKISTMLIGLQESRFEHLAISGLTTRLHLLATMSLIYMS